MARGYPMPSPTCGPYGPQTPPPVVAQQPLSPPQNNVVPPAVAGNPPLGLDGFCPVSLSEKQQWVSGDSRWGVIHRGRTYLFAGPEEQRRFFADPDRYAPVAVGQRHRPGHRARPGRARHARTRRVLRKPRVSVLERGFAGEVRPEPRRLRQSSVGSPPRRRQSTASAMAISISREAHKRGEIPAGKTPVILSAAKDLAPQSDATESLRCAQDDARPVNGYFREPSSRIP